MLSWKGAGISVNLMIRLNYTAVSATCEGVKMPLAPRPSLQFLMNNLLIFLN